jgi:hypothetical protein
MRISAKQDDPAKFVRYSFAALTIFFGVAGFVGGSGKMLAVSGAFGTMWWLWDLLIDHVVAPFAQWFGGLFTGGSLEYTPSEFTVDQRIGLLETRISQDGGDRRRIFQDAVRLIELYELQKKDPDGAKRVVAKMKERFPDAPELGLFGDR